MDANTPRPSGRGEHSHSTLPLGATRALVSQSDRNAYSAMGGNGLGPSAASGSNGSCRPTDSSSPSPSPVAGVVPLVLVIVPMVCPASGAGNLPQGRIGGQGSPAGLRGRQGVGVERGPDGLAGQLGLDGLGADRGHTGPLARRRGRGQQPRRLHGAVAAGRDQGRADQGQGRGRRLGGGQDEAGRLLEVGLGGVQVPKAGLGAGELGQGVGDAPADQLPDQDEGLPVELAGALQVAPGPGDGADLVVGVGGRAGSPVRRASTAASAWSAAARASSPRVATTAASETSDASSTQRGPPSRAAASDASNRAAAVSRSPRARAVIARVTSATAAPQWSSRARNRSRARSPTSSTRSGAPVT